MLPSSAECDGGTTCTIPESSSKGECYKEVVLHAESGAVIVTHSCAYTDRYDVTLNTACTNRSGEMACCSSTDYCNAHLSLPNAPRSQSALHEDASTVDQGSGKPLTYVYVLHEVHILCSSVFNLTGSSHTCVCYSCRRRVAYLENWNSNLFYFHCCSCHCWTCIYHYCFICTMSEKAPAHITCTCLIFFVLYLYTHVVVFLNINFLYNTVVLC